MGRSPKMLDLQQQLLPATNEDNRRQTVGRPISVEVVLVALIRDEEQGNALLSDVSFQRCGTYSKWRDESDGEVAGSLTFSGYVVYS